MKKVLSKKFLFSVAMLLVAFIYLVLLEPVARFLIVPDTQKPSEAIVVLGGGLGVPRVIHAVKLYEKGIAPIIILTGQEMEFDGRKFSDTRISS